MRAAADDQAAGHPAAGDVSGAPDKGFALKLRAVKRGARGRAGHARTDRRGAAKRKA
jgi:hypothetical protein